MRVSFVLTVVSALGLMLVVNQTFVFSRGIDFVIDSQTFMYVLAAILFPVVFLVRPTTGDKAGPIDWALFCVATGVFAYLVVHAHDIIYSSWQYISPLEARIVAFIGWLVLIEGARRTNGWPLTVVVVVMSLYPLIAGLLPGSLQSVNTPFWDLFGFHFFSFESVFGVPMKAFADLVIGFIVFGLTLQHTGASQFFNDVAFALMGRVRGGAGHVAVISSGMQASISGSVISNVMTSGSVTIPAMKRTGFSGTYAAGVEAVASTGGVLTPPVMGTTAFIMATFLNVPYSDIALAAAVPAALFYFGLLLQVDCYAASRRLKPLPEDQIPTLGAAFRDGWHYMLVFGTLIYLLVQGMNESRAAFISTGLLLVVNQYKKQHRLDLAGFVRLLQNIGRGLAEIIAVILAIGMIAGGLSATGVLSTLSTELVYLAGDTPIALLVMGALSAFILGMGMTVSACYIFLAIVLVPALVQIGYNAIAVHMFVMYWGMLSFITPPVAIATFAAASIAQESPTKIGFQAMRLGSVLYFVPFFFVMEPALLLQGTWPEVAKAISTAAVGIAAIAWGLQGYVHRVGTCAAGPLGWLERGGLIAGGLLLASPGVPSLGLGHIEIAVIGLAVIAAAVVLMAMTPGLQRQIAPRDALR